MRKQMMEKILACIRAKPPIRVNVESISLHLAVGAYKRHLVLRHPEFKDPQHPTADKLKEVEPDAPASETGKEPVPGKAD